MPHVETFDPELERAHRRMDDIERKLQRFNNPTPTVPEYDLQGIPLNTVAIVGAAAYPYQDPYAYTSRIVYTMDGVAWQAGTDPNETTFLAYGGYPYYDAGSAVCFNGSQFLLSAVNDTLHSIDGLGWTTSSPIIPDTQPFAAGAPYVSDIIYAAGKWIVGVGSSSEYIAIYTSTDGIIWTSQTEPFGSTGGWVTRLESNGSLIVACGSDQDNGNLLMHSTNGTSWIEASSIPIGDVYSYEASDVTWSPLLGIWVACVSGGPPVLLKSTDGDIWTGVFDSSSYGGRICWSSDLNIFVWRAGATSGGTVFTSPDGTTWTYQSGGDGMRFHGCTDLIWHPKLGAFFASTDVGGIWTSTDGTNWSLVSGTSNMAVSRFAYNPLMPA